MLQRCLKFKFSLLWANRVFFELASGSERGRFWCLEGEKKDKEAKSTKHHFASISWNWSPERNRSNIWGRKKICCFWWKTETWVSRERAIQSWNFFKDGPTPASFSFIFVFSYKLSSQQEKNSCCQSRRRGRWPLDHHHGPSCSQQLYDGNGAKVLHLFVPSQENTAKFTVKILQRLSIEKSANTNQILEW